MEQQKPLAVVAFGGNALITPEDSGTQGEQQERADKAAEVLVEILHRGYEMVIVHGNGPQVGNLLLQHEAAKDSIPPFTLELCVAQTQGSMGFMLENGLRYAFKKHGSDKEILCLITEVEVARNDPAFERASKPVGPFYSEVQAKHLQKALGWNMVDDAGRGWRKVVPSPRPIRVVPEPAIGDLVKQGYVVIAAGGGGVPVYVSEKGYLTGIEAVVDKDYASAILARDLRAALYVILTEVPEVYYHFNQPDQRPLRQLTVAEARDHLREGEFPSGSMGPKIEAAISYLEGGRGQVIVTNASHLKEALDGLGGTRITQ
jgi:carbamate kinase